MSAGSATDLEPSRIADATTSPRAIAIVMATSWTPSACGGTCTEDADADGICDDVDDCVGAYDACGVCNGPGAIYDCGCADIPAGDCDCDGNQLDAIGVCGGACTEDINGNGICDDVEEQGCDDPEACNYDPNALPYTPPTVDDGYCLELRTIEEHTSGPLAGMTTYRVLLHTEDPADFVTSVYGNANEPLSHHDDDLVLPGHAVGGVTARERQPGLVRPSRCWNTTAGSPSVSTTRRCGGRRERGRDGQSPVQPWTDTFDPGDGDPGSNLIMDDEVGGVWYILNGDVNGNPAADGTVLLGQFTTDGDLTGMLNIQLFPAGDNINYLTLNLPIGGNCVAEDGNPDLHLSRHPTLWIVIPNVSMTSMAACAMNSIVPGCTDALGVCAAMTRRPPTTTVPACSLTSAASAVEAAFRLAIAIVTATSSTSATAGCVAVTEFRLATVTARQPRGRPRACGGDCAADADADGIDCDDVDDCVGDYDACGCVVGPGAIYDCGCADIPAGDCDCDGNQEDAIGMPCGGDCTADVDGDGICDDVDDCVGTLDACGVCNGPGAIYDCGCADIPAGGIAIAMATKRTPLACAVETARRMQTETASVTMWTTAWATWMPAACATAREPFTTAAVMTSPQAIAIAMATKKMPWVSAVGTVPPMWTGTACATRTRCRSCTNPTACNYDPAATDNDGSCTVLDALGVCGGECTADVNGDGICDSDNVFGCVDPSACNYDENADVNNGSCDYLTCLGCTDSGAVNYDETATIDNGSCFFSGCTNPAADNYDAAADVDDGSCILSGCVDVTACNYDPVANADDGSCDFSCYGCINPTACNFGAVWDATVSDGSCEFQSCRLAHGPRGGQLRCRRHHRRQFLFVCRVHQPGCGQLRCRRRPE